MAKKFAMNWKKVTEKIKEAEKGSGNRFKDKRLYNLKVKDDGSAEAIIRFLRSPDTDLPYVKVFSHGFKESGSWLIQNCPTTIGKECPICKANSALWDEDPDTVRTRSRRASYYANILIVQDPQAPENEGKVFLYRYGKKIHEKVMGKINPDVGGIDKPVMIFDYYEGANFKLKMKQVKTGEKSFPNYDSASFSDTSTEVADGDEELIGKIDSQLFGLSEFIDKEQFKSFEDLEERFNKVIGVATAKPISTTEETAEPKNEEKKEEKETPKSDLTTEKDKDAFLKKLRAGATS